MKILAAVYFFLMAGVFPLFFLHGYNTMATDKFYFFLGAGVLLVLITLFGVFFGLGNLVVAVSRTKGKMKFLLSKVDKNLSMTDLFVFFYGFIVCLSYLSSDFKQENYYGSALWGSQGWYMGFVTQILLVLVYFIISRFFVYPRFAVGVFLGASSIVFLLGILNRFNYYPIFMEGADRGFISTMGNINWYCGYYAVVFPLGFALYLWVRKRWLRILLGGYLLLGFATGITQGSDSGLLVLGVLFVAGFWICCRRYALMQRFLETGILLCLACRIVRIFRLLFPERFNYDTDLIYMLTYRNLALPILFVLVVLYLMVCFLKRRGKSLPIIWRALRYIGVAVTVLVVLGYVALIFLNTKHPLSVPGLNGNPGFTFNGEYLNGRGASWRAGIGMFLSFPLWQRLVGIGPDCFAAYAYMNYDGIWEIVEQFGDLILTNAHNEWITMLVNVGLWGLIAYAGAFITGIYRSLRKVGKRVEDKSGEREKRLLCLACGLSLLCYTVHNVVSFQQIISTPTVFLVMGIAESIQR